jgi:hypothetical protein
VRGDELSDVSADGTFGISPALKTRSVLALVRGDVTVNMISYGHESGIGVVPAGAGFAFNYSFVRTGDRLQARAASGRVLATITVRSS